ncbi:MAG: hypothetical protein KDA37_15065, partial [Planctomycetales bacterium]|nr:hypothetical protein [Planctomycetales bacterium]
MALLCVGWPASPAVAQVTLIDWQNTAGGLFTTGANWNGGQAPVGSSLGARFDVEGNYAVQFPTDAAVVVGELQTAIVGSSGITFRPADASADAVLQIEGPLTHSGAGLTLGSFVNAGVHVESGATSVAGGAIFTISNKSALTTNRLDIADGIVGKASRLVLNSTEASDLGDVHIGETPGGVRESDLEVTAGSQAFLTSLSVGRHPAPGADAISTVSGRVTVASGGEANFGHPDSSRSAFVAVTSTGEIEFGGPAAVHASGRLKSFGGHLAFLGGLTVAGGVVEGLAGFTREFAVGTGISLTAGALLDLAEADLLLDDGHSLQVSGNSTLIADGGLTLGPTSSVLLEFGGSIPAAPWIQLAGDATLAGSLSFSVGPSLNVLLGDSFPLLAASSFEGAFNLTSAPPLPGGQAWQMTVDQGVLYARVVSGGLAGD